MPYDEIYLDASQRMDKAVEFFRNELKGIRTGRATPGLVEGIKVDYYGAPTPLRQIAAISIPDPKLIMIKPYDSTSLSSIEKAVLKSDLGLTPSSDGKIIRLTIPPLSEEQRRKLAHHLKDLAERARVSIRNIRRDANRAAEQEFKEGKMSEDDKFRLRDEIQELTKEAEEKVEELLKKKTEEVMEV
jgi:ribosome recycling factor